MVGRRTLTPRIEVRLLVPQPWNQKGLAQLASPFFSSTLFETGDSFTPLEIMLRCSAARLDFRIIPAGFNAPLEFLMGFTSFLICRN
jgi:hypothetical protein